MAGRQDGWQGRRMEFRQVPDREERTDPGSVQPKGHAGVPRGRRGRREGDPRVTSSMFGVWALALALVPVQGQVKWETAQDSKPGVWSFHAKYPVLAGPDPLRAFFDDRVRGFCRDQ